MAFRLVKYKLSTGNGLFHRQGSVANLQQGAGKDSSMDVYG